MTWELILDGYPENSYSATPRFAASRPPWFRKALWMEMGKDPELLKQFKNRNKALVTKGKPSFVSELERTGERERSELHHTKRATDGSAVYDIDNLRVATPKHHIEIHRGNKWMEKKTISDYAEVEFLEFVRKVCRAEGETEADDDKLVDELRRLAEHSDGSDLIYYPRDDHEDNPEGIVKEMKEW